MIVVAVLGMILPGYALARVLRVPGPWAAAFPLSALLLADTVVAFTLLGVPIRFGYVLGSLAVVSLVLLAVGVRRRPAVVEVPRGEPGAAGGGAFRKLAVLLAVLVVFSMGVRSAMYPLGGADTLFRWENLARLMLEHEDLSYFPPITPEDFRTYLIPDGFPPLVPAVYWWLYAAWGGPCARLTALAIAAQAASCLALTYRAARMQFGPPGGVLALAVASSSALVLRGFAIGQDTGYTLIAVAGQLAFALAAVRAPGAGLVVAAGLFAGLGSLAREYGPVLALVGFFVLAVPRGTRRYLPLYCLIPLACAGPWYVRNWVRSGNPVYLLNLGLWPPVNPVYADIFALYRSVYGVQTFSAAEWLLTAKLVVQGAFLPLIVGVAGLVAAGRRASGIALSVALVVLLWLNSVGYSSGTFSYHLRVLTPAWVLLSVTAGALGTPLLGRGAGPGSRLARVVAALAVLACGGHAVLSCWSHPRGVDEVLSAVRVTRSEPLDSYRYYVNLARMIDRSGLPPSGVLTDNYYFGVALQRHSRFRPVIIWNPEAAFVFDPRLSPVEVRRRLLARGIPLVVVQRHSINNRYLARHRFYREDSSRWLPVWKIPNSDDVYLLPLEDEGVSTGRVEGTGGPAKAGG